MGLLLLSPKTHFSHSPPAPLCALIAASQNDGKQERIIVAKGIGCKYGTQKHRTHER
jgi:hypothetical protein